MALIGNMMADAFAGNPATVNYAMFAAAFSLFSLLYLIPASINLDWSGSPFIMAILDLLNSIWFLTAGIALAARLHARNCANFVSLHPDSLPLCLLRLLTVQFDSRTPISTRSPMEHTIRRNAAARLRQLRRSCGLHSPAILRP